MDPGSIKKFEEGVWKLNWDEIRNACKVRPKLGQANVNKDELLNV